VILYFITFNGLAVSCDFSEEYLDARNEYREEVRKSYDECRNSVMEASYWYHFSQCYERSDGKNISGGCAHVIGKKSYDKLSINADHCEIFKPDLEKTNKLFEQSIKDRKIKKCKT